MRTLALLVLAAAAAPAETRVLPLAGDWNFRLDPANAGVNEGWPSRDLGPERIFLPGSTDQAGYGTKTAGPEKGWLSRPYAYEGAAWYQKSIVVPEVWRGRRVTLFLERPHWQTDVWIDGKPAGTRNSLAVPHVYDLGRGLAPGPHRLTLRVDNTYRIEVGRNAHSVTEHTQTNWNGVVGRIELLATDPVWIEEVRLTPRGNALKVEVTAGGGEAAISARLRGREAKARTSGGRAELSLPLEGVARWDEYEGALETLDIVLAADGARDFRRLRFGVREIATRGTQFTLNGRPIFLRGTLECNIFPKTGYPPMDEQEWTRLFRIARSYGLNHFRFHSWCPPEAAFAAADKAGFLLHVELPVWSNKVGLDEKLNEFMRAEARRILAEYGNHPSFTMLCLGNENTGDYGWMDRLVAELKQADPRRLYTFTADHRRREPGPTSDYWVAHNSKSGPIRIHGARYAKSMDGTDHDLSANLAENKVPLVAHELGQWVTFPDYSEIARYTGVLKPRNLEAFRDRLAERGMADQAGAFHQASGRFAWELYKEDMEAASRTPGFGGFQLLQLQDFPGQGEALIGILDSFWESKGILTPAQFRRFCNETVALLRFPKFAWRNDETFTARGLVAHYGKKPLTKVTAQWRALDDAGKEWGKGEWRPADAPPGSVTPLGEIAMPLGKIAAATRLHLTVEVGSNGIRNDWNIWVYPAAADIATPPGVLVTSSLDEAAKQRLREGGRVVVLASPKEMPIRFLPVFWSLSWFPKQPGVMGILCNPKHPALAEFPTDSGTSFQWWDALEGGRAFVLDQTPELFRPVVQVIDDYHRNHKLGAVIETRVGEGRLLAVSLDLATGLEQRPAARQLRRSLLRYAAGDAFRPRTELPLETLERLLR